MNMRSCSGGWAAGRQRRQKPSESRTPDQQGRGRRRWNPSGGQAAGQRERRRMGPSGGKATGDAAADSGGDATGVSGSGDLAFLGKQEPQGPGSQRKQPHRNPMTSDSTTSGGQGQDGCSSGTGDWRSSGTGDWRI